MDITNLVPEDPGYEVGVSRRDQMGTDVEKCCLLRHHRRCEKQGKNKGI